MATKQLADLCRVLLRDIYGDLASQLVGVLFDRGRLNARELAKHSNLPLVTVHRSLIALIQNRFVLHWTENVSLSSSVQVTYYYANWQEIYAVLWTGSILDLVGAMYYGSEQKASFALEITKNLHVYGHMKAADFLESFSHLPQQDQALLETTLSELVASKLVVPLHDYDFYPKDDIYQLKLKTHKREVAQNSSSLSESAKLSLAVTNATKEINELLSRKLELHAGLIKRDHSELEINGNLIKAAVIKKTSRIPSAIAASDHIIDRQSVVAISHAKFLVLARNRTLVEYCKTRIGPVTARVYEAALQCYESKVHDCRQFTFSSEDFNISSMEIAQRLDKQFDLVSAFYKKNKSHKHKKRQSKPTTRSSKKIKLEDGDAIAVDFNNEDDSDSEDVDSSSDSDSEMGSSAFERNEALNNHLEILANSSVPFLRKPAGSTRGEFYVPFKDVVESIRQHHYDDIIEKKFGILASRILRVVREKQKISETALSAMALLNTVELRSYTSKMEAVGCLDLQEIARGVDRAPSRTYYFWYHKPQRAYTLALEDLYKTMLNLYSRLITERLNNSVLLAKVSREDVKGNEDAYLTSQEHKEWTDLRKCEEKILVQVMRLDNLVRIFRDY